MAEIERWCGILDEFKVVDLKEGERDGHGVIMFVVMDILSRVSEDVWFWKCGELWYRETRDMYVCLYVVYV